jgi:hypothetical protein
MVTPASRVDPRWSPHSWLLTVGRSGERFHVAKTLLNNDDAIARMSIVQLLEKPATRCCGL